ncbi:DUF2637 domain-containing protein [Nocardia arthritidis]|uniref:DUF2637 domain-containing protein n=1 Tax=Nocardia arthritidis TaxID=228602 RepID=A0A6G9YK52_9NOCA|nr:DUF2637 domain-containing protein [Nocardia arthritidis]QIS13639.1 DUF2637 domain-containing protein [Nocardia arthritidis]
MTGYTGAHAVRSNDAAHRSAPAAAPTGARTREQLAAIRFFWGELLLVAAMSIAGNIVHAWINAPTGKQWVAAFVASFPPVALLAATHGVGLLVRARNKARLAYWAVAALTATIAGIAFRLSFDALTNLAIQVGMSQHLAFLFPLIVDGAIGQATIALLVLARTEPDTAEPAVRTEPVRTVSVREVRNETRTSTAEMLIHQRTPELEGAQPDPIEASAHQQRTDPVREIDRWTALAEQICSADPAGRRDPATVATILRLRHEQKYTHSQIAEQIDTSKSTVTRTLTAAEKLTTTGEDR